MYAVINHQGEAIPVSTTERGAKCIATRNRYRRVGRISPINNMVVQCWRKVAGRWIEE